MFIGGTHIARGPSNGKQHCRLPPVSMPITYYDDCLCAWVVRHVCFFFIISVAWERRAHVEMSSHRSKRLRIWTSSPNASIWNIVIITVGIAQHQAVHTFGLVARSSCSCLRTTQQIYCNPTMTAKHCTRLSFRFFFLSARKILQREKRARERDAHVYNCSAVVMPLYGHCSVNFSGLWPGNGRLFLEKREAGEWPYSSPALLFHAVAVTRWVQNFLDKDIKVECICHIVVMWHGPSYIESSQLMKYRR